MATLAVTPSSVVQNEPVVVSGSGWTPGRVELLLKAGGLTITTSDTVADDGSFAYDFAWTGTWGGWQVTASQGDVSERANFVVHR